MAKKNKLLWEIYLWIIGAVFLAGIIGGVLYFGSQDVTAEIGSLKVMATSDEPSIIKLTIAVGAYVTILLLCLIYRLTRIKTKNK